MISTQDSARNEREIIDSLQLSRSRSIGPVTFRQLTARFGSAGEAIAALPGLLRKRNHTARFSLRPRGEAEREFDAIAKLGAWVIPLQSVSYPAALAATEDAPPVLIGLGDQKLMTRKAIAVVGARNASANGRRLARQFAADLGREGLIVASGLARGIDTAAHQGSLHSGTLAVVAGGLDVIYPPENEDLYNAIVEQGTVLSEMAPGTRPQARYFPRRNRIVSGLSLGVLVVEAARNSGSLITARLALEQGREVFAVPGSPLDPRSQGGNDLIRQGAILTESTEDILRAVESSFEKPPIAPQALEKAVFCTPANDENEIAEAHGDIVSLLSDTPVAVDELIRQCQLSPAAVSSAILELELTGAVDRLPGNMVALRSGTAARTAF
ncbi:DNA-processing protein DprA [Denitrobaculum tricleocarpae]|uniref:DNA-protecting protein DprA n=1 Tax=Denitrobaculum tricleocarpae TaxID=2591009 RepID=A0A545TTT9_9PROT|nr:DNA-processing protein DprA [Denitrobaculum tricleocarpae]TQV80642.1 DNA-protecting protein DprA [Denitrobaculum tricleocarpae]